MWKVLLVEDEVFVRESVREIIAWEELGFTVAGEAGNGGEALEMIRRDPPDLVLADIVMPEMDGVELLRRTREEGYRSRFIMLTCIGEFEYVRQAMEYGASNYILKLSMSVNSLRDTLRKVSAELARDGGAEPVAQSTGEANPQAGGFGAQAATAVRAAGVTPVAAASTTAVTLSKAAASPTAAALSASTSATASAASSLSPTGTAAGISHPEVCKIIDYIAEHYAQDITVKSMAQYVMMGENYVSALFKKKTGQTLIHYLHRVRVEKAQEYLLHTELPVHEIGQRVGFINDNYFIKIFKRLTQQTPSKYRQWNKTAE
ncbi:response regulator [uncultured Paenibacillus sp.]|uniref:response regulator n=1 Tax=uncultured Paenibacillus sp. TaxID=227322 RepID=UPI0015B2A2B8|nr:response regulator [uncultured Paenibacillus sp.]